MSDDKSTTPTPPPELSLSRDLSREVGDRGGIWPLLPKPGPGPSTSTGVKTCSTPLKEHTSGGDGRFGYDREFVERMVAKMKQPGVRFATPLTPQEQDLKNAVAQGMPSHVTVPTKAANQAPLKSLKPGGLADLKAGAGGKKAPLHQWPPAPLKWGGRVGQYGGVKYHDGNYMRGPATGDDVDRLLDYISAAQRHLASWANSIMRFKGGARLAPATVQEACYAADDESGQPHGGHALASLYMGIQQAVDAGLVPEDPGITWEAVDGVLRRKA